ncbi:GNAT family N-acetyltransferase [Halalkalibacter akibai]|uniref:Acetyltransferase n=1 Tax=Halalkalibacter akibai (strain ATCC 43226 / DSM 21942 / CIP 109018 / JCM 9157 / 1139) TaxID=1236973 RepID=W4QWE3_HALA3|nr:GNAT family N-acetyltransferase [Halalkalibacter akibai]GAE36237.1 acetyltransferase [Halalkalibacter akibai JCM 9157]
MIRRLSSEDYTSCMTLLNDYPAENLFLISDIETFGFEEDFQQVWGEFNEQGQLKALMLNYEGNFIPYSPGEFDAKGFADLFSEHPKAVMLSGLENVTSKMIPYITVPLKHTRKLFYAKCDSPSKLMPVKPNTVKKATLADIDKISTLYSQITEFERPSSPEERKRNMELGVSRTYYIEDANQFVSAVSTAAENNVSAMVVGVCTLEAFKRKGLASQCLNQLTNNLLQEGKSVCLFYDNPEAGRIYKRLGYEDMEMWTMTIKK